MHLDSENANYETHFDSENTNNKMHLKSENANSEMHLNSEIENNGMHLGTVKAPTTSNVHSRNSIPAIAELSDSVCSTLREDDDVKPNDSTTKREPKNLTAEISIDVWSFGATMFELMTVDCRLLNIV